jgi:hypothetical protein
MHRRRVLSAFALVVVPMLAGGRPTIATAAGVFTGDHDHDHHDDHDEDCERKATTGRATASRRCDGTRTEAHVDNRPPQSGIRSAPRKHEHPIDRLRSRGKGRIQATGDKGARRELREKGRRGS